MIDSLHSVNTGHSVVISLDYVKKRKNLNDYNDKISKIMKLKR